MTHEEVSQTVRSVTVLNAVITCKHNTVNEVNQLLFNSATSGRFVRCRNADEHKVSGLHLSDNTVPHLIGRDYFKNIPLTEKKSRLQRSVLSIQNMENGGSYFISTLHQLFTLVITFVLLQNIHN
jgi:hypothetical protein